MPAIQPDPRYIDCDFTREPQFTFGDLGARRFGAQLPTFEDAIPLIDESQWQPMCEQIDASAGWTELLVTRIFNQGSEGSCVSNATTQAHEVIQAQQFGKDAVVQLSPISLYKRVARSAGSGSMLSDNLDELTSRGALPLDTPENVTKFKHTMPATGFNRGLPQGWEDTAKLFCSLEWFDIRTVAGLATALLKGWPVVVGRGGHSIVYVRPFFRNGSLAVWFVNSWGNWGQGLGGFPSGFGVDTLSLIRQSASWAFALRSVNAQLAA